MNLKNIPYVIVLCTTLSLFAEPNQFRVISGEASTVVSPDTATLLIRSGNKTILEWDQFSLDQGKRIQFQQFDKNSAILNRVMSGTQTSILGELLSNGKVYVINPHGVFIGPGARIETASFVASSLDILDKNFLEDKFLFSGSGRGSVVNLGEISCPSGNVSLIARQVKNSGQIMAPEGSVAMAAGMEVLLQPSEKQSIFIRPVVNGDAQEAIEGFAVEQTGSIQALVVELNSGISPYAKAIHASGNINATTISERGGKVYLVAESGLCEVKGSIDVSSSGQGGHIRVLGEEVRILDNSRLIATGATGGGEILIGGDYQGQNAAIKNAQYTWVAKDVEIVAHGGTGGDGGKVILWGDESTAFYGKIDIRGGEHSGNGGLAEVSAKQLQYVGQTDGRASHGTFGTLLLDPTNVTISTAASTGGPFSTCGTFTPPAVATYNIKNTDLQSTLANCSVTITTVGSTGSGNGSIVVSAPVSWASAASLSLNANANISITSPINATGAGSINLLAAGTTSAANADGITIGTGGSLHTNTGAINLSGTTASNQTFAGHGVNLNSTNSQIIRSESGNITIVGKVVNPLTASVSNGININTVDAIVTNSTNSTITLTGSTTGLTNVISAGVRILKAWNTGTTGQLNFINCFGGTSAGSAIRSELGSAVQTTGGILGAGISGAGIAILTNAPIGSTGGGTINISASSTGTGVSATAIQISAALSTTGTADITLSGSGGPSASNGISHGILLGGPLSTGSGTINLAGLASGAGNSSGVIIRATNALNTTGNINISGVSTATGEAHGVYIVNPQTLASQGTVVFGLKIANGGITVEGCVGGGSTTGLLASHGLSIGNFSTLGHIIASNQILSGFGPSSCGMTTTGTVSAAGNVNIVASSRSTAPSGNAVGISINGPLTTTAGAINLNGTGTGTFAGTAQTRGVFIAGSTTVISNKSQGGTGPITITGTVPSSYGGVGIGIQINATATPSLEAPNGTFTISGVSQAQGVSSSGISLINWSTGTSQPITFDTCSGGSGVNSHGIFVSNALTTGSGGIVAKNGIRSGTGEASHGFLSTAVISTTGNIEIVASSASKGALGGYGIFLSTGGLGQAVGGTGPGSVTLTGTSSETSNSTGAPLAGIYVRGGISSFSGPISLTGIGPTSASNGRGLGIFVQLQTGASIISNSGSITLSGKSGAVGINSYGVNVLGGWTPNTTGDVVFTNCSGGSGISSHAVALNGPITTKGKVTATTGIVGGSGAGSSGFFSNGNLTAGGTIAITASTLANGLIGRGIELAGGIVTTNGGNITLIGTGSSSNSVTNSYGVNLYGNALISNTTAGGATISITGVVPTIVAPTTNIASVAGVMLNNTSSVQNLSGGVLNLQGAVALMANPMPGAIYGVLLDGASYVSTPAALITISGTVAPANMTVPGGAVSLSSSVNPTTAPINIVSSF